MSHAFVYPLSGLATIYDGDQLWVLDIKDGPEPKLVPNFHERTRTLYLEPPLKIEDAGANPYPVVLARMTLEYMKDRAWQLILISLDSELTMDLRKRAADTAMLLMNDQDIRSWLVKTFRSKLIPLDADRNGVPSEALKQFFLQAGI